MKPLNVNWAEYSRLSKFVNKYLVEEKTDERGLCGWDKNPSLVRRLGEIILGLPAAAGQFLSFSARKICSMRLKSILPVALRPMEATILIRRGMA